MNLEQSHVNRSKCFPGSGVTIAGTLLLALALLVPARAQILQQDSLALVALYDSTNGASWTNNTNWLTANALTIRATENTVELK